MSERTPGPWHLVIVPDMGPDGEPYFYIEAEKDARKGLSLPNATCVVDPEGGILIEDDARLIAAAPKMLAALKMAATELGKASGGSTILEVLKVGPLARTIDRAIALAEESSP